MWAVFGDIGLGTDNVRRTDEIVQVITRKPNFPEFWFWPATGWPYGFWGDSNSPDVDAWARCSRALSEHVTRELSKLGLSAPVSEMRLITGPHSRSAGREVDIDLSTPDGTRQWGVARIPEGFADLSTRERASVVHAAVSTTLSRLGTGWGWDPAAVHGIFDVRPSAGMFRYDWHGGWKLNPGRRQRARVVVRLTPASGYAESVLEIEDVKSGELRFVGPFTGHSTVQGSKRSEKTLRWRNQSEVIYLPYGETYPLAFLQFEERWKLGSLKSGLTAAPFTSPGVPIDQELPESWRISLR